MKSIFMLRIIASGLVSALMISCAGPGFDAGQAPIPRMAAGIPGPPPGTAMTLEVVAPVALEAQASGSAMARAAEITVSVQGAGQPIAGSTLTVFAASANAPMQL